MRSVTFVVVSANAKRRHDYKDKSMSGCILHQHTIKMSYENYIHARRRYIHAELYTIARLLWNKKITGKKLRELHCELLYNREYIRDTLEPKMLELTKLLITATTQALLGRGQINMIYENTKKR